MSNLFFLPRTFIVLRHLPTPSIFPCCRLAHFHREHCRLHQCCSLEHMEISRQNSSNRRHSSMLQYVGVNIQRKERQITFFLFCKMQISFSELRQTCQTLSRRHIEHIWTFNIPWDGEKREERRKMKSHNLILQKEWKFSMFNTQKWWRQWRRRHTYIELHSSAAADNISASSFFEARFHFEKEIFHSIRLTLFSLHCLWHEGGRASVYEKKSHNWGARDSTAIACRRRENRVRGKNAITVNVKCNKTMKNFQFKCRSVKRDDILLRAMVHDGRVTFQITRHTASERVIECTGRIGKRAHKWILHHKKRKFLFVLIRSQHRNPMSQCHLFLPPFFTLLLIIFQISLLLLFLFSSNIVKCVWIACHVECVMI